MRELSLGAIPFLVDHTADNIKDTLISIVQSTLEMDANNMFPVITIDSASNMLKAFRGMTGWTHVRCALHSIHNAVLAGLKGWLPRAGREVCGLVGVAGGVTEGGAMGEAHDDDVNMLMSDEDDMGGQYF